MLKNLPLAFLAILIAPVFVGCESDEEPVVVATCAEENVVGGVCAGAPAGDVCAEDYCTAGIQCTKVHQVNSDSQLASVSSGAQPGECIALAPGTYGHVSLPVAVSLLGKGASHVTVGGVTTQGAGVYVRGLTIDNGSLEVSGGDTHVDGTVLRNSIGDAIVATDRATIYINQSEVVAASRYGVSAFGAALVDIKSSIIRGASGSGPGLWAQCDLGCDCEEQVEVNVVDTKFEDNSLVGISIVGAHATLNNVEVRGTTTGQNFQHGGGVSVSSCSQLDATGLTVSDNADFGVLVDDSGFDVDGLTVSNNLRGVWVQRIGMTMSNSPIIRNAEISNNEGVGIGVALGSTGVTVEDSSVLDTREIVLPVLIGGVSAGSDAVGDGLAWKGGSDSTLRGVTIGGSARASLLIDGPVGSGSLIDNVTLINGDEGKGILQQNLPDGGAQPATSGSTPTVTAQVGETHAVPDDLIPPSIAPQP